MCQLALLIPTALATSQHRSNLLQRHHYTTAPRRTPKQHQHHTTRDNRQQTRQDDPYRGEQSTIQPANHYSLARPPHSSLHPITPPHPPSILSVCSLSLSLSLPQPSPTKAELTTTQRNQAPAALLKDRHSRSGLPLKAELARKNGAGAHNWGSFKEEGDLEQQAFNDADAEVFDMDAPVGAEPIIPTAKHAEADTIATSPSESMSSTSDAGVGEVKPVQLNRRMSNVSEEERERARVYREGVVRRASHNGSASPPPQTCER